MSTSTVLIFIWSSLVNQTDLWEFTFQLLQFGDHKDKLTDKITTLVVILPPNTLKL